MPSTTGFQAAAPTIFFQYRRMSLGHLKVYYIFLANESTYYSYGVYVRAFELKIVRPDKVFYWNNFSFYLKSDEILGMALILTE